MLGNDSPSIDVHISFFPRQKAPYSKVRPQDYRICSMATHEQLLVPDRFQTCSELIRHRKKYVYPSLRVKKLHIQKCDHRITVLFNWGGPAGSLSRTVSKQGRRWLA